MPKKLRLDQLLVGRGLFPSREQARRAVMAGTVKVGTRIAVKPSELLEEEAPIAIKPTAKYVGRGALKLESALDYFKIDVRGKRALDIGASTGGFTDCMLQRGAGKVYAVDVGYGQLNWKLRNDPRVVVREGVNARYLNREDFPEQFDLAVCDVSFISVTLILPAVAPLLQSDGEMVILIKPQFEVGKGQVGKGGIVRDPELHRSACRRIEDAVRLMNYTTDMIESPILGAEGNKEFLLYARH